MSPWDLKATLLAKHAQHVVLIHFPIALFLSALALHCAARFGKNKSLLRTVQINFILAAATAPLAVATGLLAWNFALEAQPLKGLLLLHLIAACVSSAIAMIVGWMHFQDLRHHRSAPSWRMSIEFAGAALIAATAHLGGFLSGVNVG